MTMVRAALSLVAGIIFGAGLVLSGMSDPAKVMNFLDLGGIASGAWDPSLALVMAGALAVAGPGFALVRRSRKPVLAERFNWPTRQAIDAGLICGSLLFGIGWGLAGICPGPAVTLVVFDPESAALFIVPMLLGMLVRKLTEPK